MEFLDDRIPGRGAAAGRFGVPVQAAADPGSVAGHLRCQKSGGASRARLGDRQVLNEMLALSETRVRIGYDWSAGADPADRTSTRSPAR